MTDIILCGCGGKMGRVVTALAKEDPDVRIVAGVDPASAGDGGYPVFESIEYCDIPADVIVDFSSSQALDGILRTAAEKKLPAVLCSTGYSAEQLERIREVSGQVALLRSANMSLGVNTILKLVQAAAQVLAEEGFDIEIVEKHHNQKLDAPSGTAIALADAMNEVLKNEYFYTYDRSEVRRKRDKKEIGISSVRGGSIVGEHEVIFAGTDEVVTISHTAYSRAIFGKGALAAAKFLAGKKPGLYGMQDVIG